MSDLAARVQCPTLILHARDDHRVPLESARDFAALIPDSRLVPLPSSNHILTSEEPAWPMFLDELNLLPGSRLAWRSWGLSVKS